MGFHFFLEIVAKFPNHQCDLIRIFSRITLLDNRVVYVNLTSKAVHSLPHDAYGGA